MTPIGLYEGLMGNSGLAISDSMAASYYNPSLLMHKMKSAYSLSANTFEQFNSHSDNSDFSSTTMNPGYLSSTLVGDLLTHEFFILGLLPSRVHQNIQSTDGSGNSNTSGDISSSYYMFGYSMAARDLPLAFSFFANYFENQSSLSTEFTSASSPVRSVSMTSSQIKFLDFGISASSHVRWQTYTLGFQYRSRRFRLYKKADGTVTTFTHGSPTTSDYLKTQTSLSPASTDSTGESFSIGHGFKWARVEILTDTVFNELSDLSHSLVAFQSFGLRVGHEDGHQFLCGFNQQLGNKISYFGQATYYSVGYSWKTRELRSAFGAFYSQNNIDQLNSEYGLTYSSEFSY